MARHKKIGRPDRDSEAAELLIPMAVYVPRDAAFFKADLAINHKDDGDARNDTQSNN